jgi:hypothetical protein
VKRIQIRFISLISENIFIRNGLTLVQTVHIPANTEPFLPRNVTFDKRIEWVVQDSVEFYADLL